MKEVGFQMFIKRVVANMNYEQRDKLVTLGHASAEWVMGRYLTPDTVLTDRRQKQVMK